MPPQSLCQGFVHGDAPGFVILSRVLLTGDHVQLSCCPVYIFPVQVEQLFLAQSGIYRTDNQRIQVIRDLL